MKAYQSGWVSGEKINDHFCPVGSRFTGNGTSYVCREPHTGLLQKASENRLR